ncbi:MAG: cytochrome C oxidase subunit IV family protein [Acidimicrobiales bacterium]
MSAHAEGGPTVETTPEEGGAKHAHEHPSDWEYIKVAILLAAITLAEVLVYYIESLGDWLILILVVMSVFKFGVVVLWFMHLRFDSRLFRRLFVTGLVLAFAVYGIVLTSFGVWTR